MSKILNGRDFTEQGQSKEKQVTPIRTLRIQLTEKCNLRCVFCCHEGTACKYNIIKDSNVITLIQACVDTLGIQRIKFTGGEPLLHDGNIFSIMRAIPDKRISWAIVTNATDISRMKEYLDRENFDVTISLPVPMEADYSDYWDITHPDDKNLTKFFDNVRETVAYAIKRNRKIKINYVLCKGKNDSPDQLKQMIELARKSECIDLRFLETVINGTNDSNHRMENYQVTEQSFTEKIKKIYPNVSIDSSARSHAKYSLDGKTSFRLVKFFCSDDCSQCPDDKTSLWLTPTGTLKKCSFQISDIPISSWVYTDICNLLAKNFVPKRVPLDMEQ